MRNVMLIVLSVVVLSCAGCFDKALLRIGQVDFLKAASQPEAKVCVLEIHETEF